MRLFPPWSKTVCVTLGELFNVSESVPSLLKSWVAVLSLTDSHEKHKFHHPRNKCIINVLLVVGVGKGVFILVC